MTKRAAIILAGGKAKRFQTSQNNWQDKALVKFNGKPLLIQAIENIRHIVEEIIIVVNENESRISQYRNVLKDYHIENARLVTDIKIKNQNGPLIAILTGLKYAKADYCITVPCDAPLLNSKVVEYLFSEIKNSSVVVPMWPNGRLETLIMVLKRNKTLEIANVLSQLGRSHPDDIIRGSLRALFVSPLGEIKILDPELKSFVNINCPEDLNRLKPRQGEGHFIENIRLNLGTISIDQICHFLVASSKMDASNFLEASKLFSDSAIRLENMNSFFWSALSREYEAKSLLSLFELGNQLELIKKIEIALLRAARNYGLEAQVYEKNNCYLLAQRAKANKLWCESRLVSLAIK